MNQHTSRSTRFMLVATFIVTFGVAMAAHGEDDTAAQRQADQLLVAALAQDRGPGMMAAVRLDGALVWSGAIGWADVEARVPLAHDSRMRLGSVSKPLAAALVVRLVSLDRLDLDAPIRTYLPAYPETGSAITTRQLAAHTSGIRHYDFTNFAEANNTQVLEDLEEALPRVWNDPLVAPPGTRVEYTSWGYNVLGAVAQRAAGQSFLDAFAAHVAGPLALVDTVGDQPLALVPRRSRFYTIKDDGTVINTIWRDSSDCYPSCGMLSTARDLTRFTALAFSGDALGHGSRDLFETEVRLADGSGSGRTVGWEIRRREDGSVLWIGHGGETNGGIAIVRYYPDSRLAVAGLANYNFWYAGEPTFFETVSTKIPALFGVVAPHDE